MRKTIFYSRVDVVTWNNGKVPITHVYFRAKVTKTSSGILVSGSADMKALPGRKPVSLYYPKADIKEIIYNGRINVKKTD